MRPPKPWEWEDREPQVGDVLVYNGQGWVSMAPGPVSTTSTIPSLQRRDACDLQRLVEEDHDRWVQSLQDRYGPKPEFPDLPETPTYRTVVEEPKPAPGFWSRLWRWLRGDPQER